MKKIILAVASFILFIFNNIESAELWSKYKALKAGIRPIAVIPDSENNYNVFCAGWDANYNEVFEPDSGDVRASWWKIKHNDYSIEKIMDFEWPLLDVPFRPYVIDSKIYIHHNHGIKSYNIITGELLDSNVSNLDAIAVSVLDNKIFLSLRVDENKDWVIDSNFVVVLDLIKKKVLDTIPAYSYVQQTLPFKFNGLNYLAILNEGAFGQNDSKIQIIRIDGDSFEEIKVIDIGSAGNHLAYKNNILTVVVNSSKQVHLIEPKNFEINHTILLDVPPWDGPREAMQLSSDSTEIIMVPIAVSAYDGFVYLFEYDGLTDDYILSEKLKCDGKPEGMYYDSYNNSILIANPYISGTYNPNDSITIFRYTTEVSEFNNENLNIQVFPNPISFYSILTIRGAIKDNHYNIELVGISGNVVKRFICFHDKFNQIKLALNYYDVGINAGLYFLKISDGFDLFTFPVLFLK